MTIPNKNKESDQPVNDGTENVFSIVPKLTVNGRLTFYENQLKWCNYDDLSQGGEPPDREENDIKSFSKKSRLRLFHIFTTLNYSAYGEPRFVSNTWHYDAPDQRADIKSFLDRYIKRLKRSLPPFHAIWKFEYQERGTPHFHFMIFPLDKEENFFTDKIEEIIKTHWLELKQCKCSDCEHYAVKVKPVKDYGHAMIYISKEIAKLQDRYEDHNLGRIWGTSRNLRVKEFDSFECTFDDYCKLLSYILQNFDLDDKTKTYLMGLKWWEKNSSLFFSYKDLIPIIINLKHKPQFKKKKVGKVTLRKYKFNDHKYYNDL